MCIRDRFKLSCRVSAKRLFPNFSFIDAPFNLQYYKEGHPETEIAYMGCRTRVIGNVHDKSREIVPGRGNLSFTSINLPRIGIEAKGDIGRFYELLDQRIDLVCRQLLHRFKIQCSKKAVSYTHLAAILKTAPATTSRGKWIPASTRVTAMKQPITSMAIPRCV